MVTRSEAPPPGWYPDPTGRRGLLWWDGSDWSRQHRRPAPASASWDGSRLDDGSGEVVTETPDGAIPSATQLRARAAATAEQRRAAERELTDAVAEARRVARSEVDRAISQATRQLTQTRAQWEPRIAAFQRRLRRWSRIAVVVVVLFVALSTWSSATLQVGLLEWLGERIDTVTGAAVPGWAPVPSTGITPSG